MSSESVAQNIQTRKAKAIQIIKDSLITLGRGALYTCRSQTQPGIEYEGAAPGDNAALLPGFCTCPDRFRPCKHMLSARMLGDAIEQVRRRQIGQDLTYSQIVDRCQAGIESGRYSPGDVDKLHIMIAAARALIAREGRIELVVSFRTSGARHLPHAEPGELVELYIDGEKREPKTTDGKKIIDWLASHAYNLITAQWIDPAGYARRKRMIYAKGA